MEDEEASWCTTLFLKCKKTKKLFMVTVPPGSKPDLKPLAKLLGSKELRLADEKSRACLSLSDAESKAGCLTAMSVVGDKEGVVTSVLDEGILNPAGFRCRMCSGCRDFKNHAQHRIAEITAEVLVDVLKSSGHEPMVIKVPVRKDAPKKPEPSSPENVTPPKPPDNDGGGGGDNGNNGNNGNDKNDENSRPGDNSSGGGGGGGGGKSGSNAPAAKKGKGGFGCNVLSTSSIENKVNSAVDAFLDAYMLSPFSKKIALPVRYFRSSFLSAPPPPSYVITESRLLFFSRPCSYRLSSLLS